ncbi:MAG TPA: hypothetical protein VMM37_09710 [Bacteroidota bacterium]|nr:hypothetical protein [Bacteroidota bacterium]
MKLKPLFRCVVVPLGIIVFTGRSNSQSKPPADSLGTGLEATPHRLEFGLNALGLGIEYRYYFLSFASADAVLSGVRPGAALGVTLSPLSLVVVQGIYGTGKWEEAPIADGPPALKPDYVYGWMAGLHIPFAPERSPVYLQFGGGQLIYVQRHYLYNVYGLIVPPPPVPLYRREVRKTGAFILSLGFTIQ